MKLPRIWLGAVCFTLLVVVTAAPAQAGKRHFKQSFPFLFAKKSKAERLGTQYASAWLDIAEARVDAAIYDGPDCERDPLGEVEVGVCRATDSGLRKVERIRRKIAEAYAQGKIPGAGGDPRTPESYAFSLLRQRQLHPDERLRFEAFNALVSLCEREDLGTAGTQRDCPAELESAATTILGVEDHPLTRHLALEVLARNGAASDAGRDLLLAIVERDRPTTRTCLSVLEFRGSGQVEAVAKGFAGHVYFCETPLARTALGLDAAVAGSAVASAGD